MNANTHTPPPRLKRIPKQQLRRFLQFLDWCEAHGHPRPQRLDGAAAMAIAAYARALGEGAERGELAPSTAINRLAALNTGFRALGAKGQVVSPRAWVSPQPAIEPLTDPQCVFAAFAECTAAGLAEAVRTLRLCLGFGVRIREAYYSTVVEDRSAPGGLTLEFLRGRSESDFDRFVRTELEPARAILAQHGIASTETLRATFACNLYQELTGCKPPVIRRPGSRLPTIQADREARLVIARTMRLSSLRSTAKFLGPSRARLSTALSPAIPAAPGAPA